MLAMTSSPFFEVTVLEMSDAEELKPASAFVWIFQGLKFTRLAEFGEFFPQLELLEGGEKTAVAVGSTSAPLGEGVVFGVPGERNHVAGKGHGLAGPADGREVPAEPLVVMSEVVDLVGHDTVPHHVGVVGAGGSFLAPGGGVVALELGVDVWPDICHM